LISPSPDGGLRRRPAFLALATLLRELGGATFLGPLPAPPEARLYRFRRGGDEVAVAWSAGDPSVVRLPRPAVGVIGRCGERLPAPEGLAVAAGPSPRYYLLGPS
jgi:hypothetical protein